MSDALPRLMQLSRIPQPELIAHRQPDLSTLQLRQPEPRHPLLIQPQIPPHTDIRLRLALLQPLIVVRLDLDQRPEDVLVLIRVLVPEQDRLRLVVDARLFEVLERR